MHRKIPRLRNEAGFGIAELVILVSLVALAGLYATPSYRQKIKDAQKDGLSLSDMVNTLASPPKEQGSPLSNPSKTQEQASPFKSFFPVGTADPFKQPQQPSPPLPESVGAENNQGGSPVDYCEARWASQDNGKTKTPVPGSCNKAALHGSSCSHFPSFH